MASTREQKERLESILDTLSVVIDGAPVGLTRITPYDDTTEINASDLPAFCVYQPGKAQHHRQTFNELQTSRDWFILFFIAGIKDDNPISKQEAYEACYPYLDALAAWFARHLSLADYTAEDDDNPNGLPGVTGMDIREDGVGETKRGAKRYSAIAYRLNITNVTDL